MNNICVVLAEKVAAPALLTRRSELKFSEEENSTRFGTCSAIREWLEHNCPYVIQLCNNFWDSNRHNYGNLLH